MPYDTPILGYLTNTANTLRLWRAEAPESFDFAVLNRGDYYGAVNQKVTSEHLTKVLYPNDEQLQGKARSGRFSSDRTIAEYARDTWSAPSVPVDLLSNDDDRAGLLQ